MKCGAELEKRRARAQTNHKRIHTRDTESNRKDLSSLTSFELALSESKRHQNFNDWIHAILCAVVKFQNYT